MPRYALLIQYDGTPYVGYQVQDNGVTVQSTLERALRRIAKVDAHTRVPNTVSGRTDSGVHALGQVVHVDFPYDIPTEGFRRALNSILDTSIRVIAVSRVGQDFHARYSAVSKHYRYLVDTSDYPNPFTRQFMMHHPYSYNLADISQALTNIIGEHDFTSFCSIKTDKEDKVRTIYQAQVSEDRANHQLIFDFHGNGFLYNMVRILVGTLMQIGDGIRPVDDMRRLLTVCDRQQAGPTVPPHGLYLVKVTYEPEIFDYELASGATLNLWSTN